MAQANLAKLRTKYQGAKHEMVVIPYHPQPATALGLNTRADLTCTVCNWTRIGTYLTKQNKVTLRDIHAFDVHVTIIENALELEPPPEPKVVLRIHQVRIIKELWIWHVNVAPPRDMRVPSWMSFDSWPALVQHFRDKVFHSLAVGRNTTWTTNEFWPFASPHFLVSLNRNKEGVITKASWEGSATDPARVSLLAMRQAEQAERHGYRVEVLNELPSGLTAPAADFMQYVEEIIATYQKANGTAKLLNGVQELDQVLTFMEVLEQLRDDLKERLSL